MNVPALRQSIYEQMSCEHGYSLVHIQGFKPPNTTQSDRGTDVHAILAAYTEHCAAHRVEADFSYLDGLLSDATEEVATIIETCRGSFNVDWQNFFAAEISVGLDRHFRPTYSLDHDGRKVPVDPLWADSGTDEYPAYAGILDTIYLMPGDKVARIVDYKSHPRPFEPTTFQAKLYSLMLFMHMPSLQEIEFVLRFVRYPNVSKPIKFYRSQVPDLMEDARRQRARQESIHERVSRGLELRVHGGAQCTYCPCVLSPLAIPCPIAQMNPRLNMSPAERLSWRLQREVENRANNQALKEYVESTGLSIDSTDANGNHYTFGPVTSESSVFPLFDWNQDTGAFTPVIVDKLLDWALTDSPEDCQPNKRSPIPWLAKLRIGATQLKPYLRSGKRADLDQWIKDNAAKSETKVQLKITRDAAVDDGQGSEYREYGDEGDWG